MNKEEKKIKNAQGIEIIKSQGVSISRWNIKKLDHRAYIENASVIAEGARERAVLRMKSFYKRRGWAWPPKTMRNVTSVHLINGYYGKELVKHDPKDELEKKVSATLTEK